MEENEELQFTMKGLFMGLPIKVAISSKDAAKQLDKLLKPYWSQDNIYDSEYNNVNFLEESTHQTKQR